MLSLEELERRLAEGYAAELPGIEPAVVAFTTQVAAAAVGELIERFVGYGPKPAPNELILRIHDRELSHNRREPEEGHFCHFESGKLGLGFTEPFLEQNWTR
jgi:hypothetical protein